MFIHFDHLKGKESADGEFWKELRAFEKEYNNSFSLPGAENVTDKITTLVVGSERDIVALKSPLK